MNPKKLTSPASDPAFEIHIRLRASGDLFNSLDPSPLVERDIDDIIEDYIVDCVGDAPRKAPLRLCLHLPGDAEATPEPGALQASVRNYFAFLRARQAGRLRRFLRQSRRQALAGLFFLSACITGSQLVSALGPDLAASLISEGLIILGWVANWKPLSAFLYDWRPMGQQVRTYERLSQVELSLVRELTPSPFSGQGE
jgi:hypothetical protein